MFGLVRNAVVIGVIAYFSPVHEQDPQARLESLRSIPSRSISEMGQAAPGLAFQALQAIEPQSRDALARLALEAATGRDLTPRRP